jgi:hypothetical protein
MSEFRLQLKIKSVFHIKHISNHQIILFFWAPRLAALAVGLSAHSPRSEVRGQHSRGQELPPVALPLLLPIRPPPLRAIRYNPWREVNVELLLSSTQVK